MLDFISATAATAPRSVKAHGRAREDEKLTWLRFDHAQVGVGRGLCPKLLPSLFLIGFVEINLGRLIALVAAEAEGRL